MPLPLYHSVPITGKIQKLSSGIEKLHMIFTKKNNNLIPSTISYLSFKSATEYKEYFGEDEDYKYIQKYFNFLSKESVTPDKVIISNWYEQSADYFFKGTKLDSNLNTIKTITAGELKYTDENGEKQTISNLDFSSAGDLNDVATILQTAINGSIVIYNENLKLFYITNSNIVSFDKTETSEYLGLLYGSYSPAIENAESFVQYCDRIFKANSNGYSITINEQLSNEDMLRAIEWLQTVEDGQTYNTLCRLVFNWKGTIASLEAFKNTVDENYTGYVICYDPNDENINILSCSICSSTNYETGSSKNFNYQFANGYTPITNSGNIIDYQAGQDNINLVKHLDELKVSYVYSQGTGENEQIFYGKGLVAGDFFNESIMSNEAWFERNLQQSIFDSLIAAEKIKIQGSDSDTYISNAISPVFGKAQTNGVIAYNGTLDEKSKTKIIAQTKNSSAPDSVEQNGYYYVVWPVINEDLEEQKRRITICYLCGGELNKVQINNYIYRG